MPLTEGSILLDRYRVDALLGQGGMGAVYLAYDLNLRMRVAVKENHDTSASAQRQFKLEGQLLAQLSHPNLPRVTDHFFVVNQGQYLVMDYIDGEDLDAMIERVGPLPETYAVPWIVQVCDALSYLHHQTPPVVHRDIKPANVRIRPDGTAMLVDFGIAKMYDPTLATTIGAKAVTPGFSPPEQYGGGTTDARSDVYALGATLYTLLTGETLPESVQRMTGAATITPPRHIKSTISLHVEAAILKAIDVHIGQRFQTVDDFRAGLLGQPIESVVSGGSPPPDTQPPAIRRPIGVIVAIGAVLLLIAGGALLTQPPTSPTPIRITQVVQPPGRSGLENTVTVVRPATVTPVPPTFTPAPPVVANHLIAYEAGTENNWQIYLADPVTGQVWRLPGQPRNSTVPAWLPDGEHIAFRSDAGGSWQIYMLKIDGTDLQQITSGNGHNYEPNYSPDGSRIAFVSDRDGNKEIYLMNSDGSSQQRLTDNSGLDDDPNWSSDGNWLAYESRHNNRTDVYRMRPDGSDQTRLTSAGKNNSTPAWSPDSQWIAFEREEGSTSHIWIMDANGRNQRQITFDGTYNVRPAWSADGLSLVYNSDRDGPVEVWISPVDGSASPRRISNGEGFDPAWARK